MSPLALWASLEEPFSRHFYDGHAPDWMPLTSPHAGVHVAVGATRPRVVVTAPHATGHYRNGTRKGADRGTGGLALALHQLAGVTAVVAASADGDANYDLEHPLKSAVFAVEPEFVIDLHGMAARSDCDVDLGVSHGLTPAHVEQALGESTLRVTRGKYFDATRQGTLTATMQRAGVPALQLEISATHRPPTGTPSNMTALLTVLTALLTDDLGGQSNAPRPA